MFTELSQLLNKSAISWLISLELELLYQFTLLLTEVRSLFYLLSRLLRTDYSRLTIIYNLNL